MLDKTVIKNNKRFLVNSPDTFLANLFIEECIEVHKDYELMPCYDSQTFIETLNRGTLFNSGNKMVTLAGLTDDMVQDIEFISNYETDDILILVETSILSKNKAYTKLKASFVYQKLENLSEKECRTWLHTYMIKQNLKFVPEIPAYIIKKRGTDLRALANEVKKLKLLGKEVTEALCANIISDSNESDFYTFIDHFEHKRIIECLQEFKKVDETQYIQLLHFMIGHIEKLYKVSIFREQKKSSEEIAELMGLPKFVITTKFYTSMSIFGKVKLLMILDLLNELDIKLRLTKYDNKQVFEFYMLKMFKL
jgi:DNA polymerase III delta subunit